MHILIFPSLFFVTKHHPNAGIFQEDHAKLFAKSGHKVGVLAIKPLFLWRHLYFDIRRFIKKLLFIKSEAIIVPIFKQVLILLKTHLSSIENLLVVEARNNITVIRYTGCFPLNIRGADTKTKELKFWNELAEIALEKYIKINGKPDIIHAHNLIFSGLVTQKLSKKFGIPFVLTARSSEHLNEKRSEKFDAVIKQAFLEIANINAVSPAFIKQLEEKYDIPENKVSWLPNMIDPLFENALLSRKSRSNKKVRFLNVASLRPIKGQDILIEAFASAFSEDQNVELIIGGEGYYRNHLEEKIKELKQEDRITLLGYLTRQQAMEQMDQADVFVFSSLYETFGVVVIEALSRGLPVLCTRAGGPESVINDNNGILVEPNSVDALSAGLIEISKIFDQYSPGEMRKNVIERFGSNQFYNRTIKIYKKVIDDYYRTLN